MNNQNRNPQQQQGGQGREDQYKNAQQGGQDPRQKQQHQEHDPRNPTPGGDKSRPQHQGDFNKDQKGGMR